MKNHKKPYIIVLMFLGAFLFLLVNACDVAGLLDDVGDDDDHTPGENLPSEITGGDPITLPDEVKVKGITGGADCDIGEYPITIELRNTSFSSTSATFEAGSNFWCENGDTQNLILVYDVTIDIPKRETVTECLPTFCLNSDLGAPGTYDEYILGTVYTDACIGKIIEILNDKDPDTFDYYDLGTIQDAIWECMDVGEISEYTLEELENI